MSRMWWIIILVGVGIAAAIAIGVLGTRNEPSKSEAVSTLCGSLDNLDASVKALTGLDPSTATTTEYQTDVQAVQDDWSTVMSDAQAVQDAPMGSLDSAWDSFESAVKDVPDDASVSDALNSITAAAQDLVSAAESTAASVNCSTSS